MQRGVPIFTDERSAALDAIEGKTANTDAEWGQADAMAMRISLALSRTWAPILRSLRRIEPHVALARRVFDYVVQAWLCRPQCAAASA